MKLRIQGNLLRFRLTQNEVVHLHDTGLVECAILVEKDFQCLHKPSEWDPEGYPHPLAVVKKRYAG